MGDYCHIGLGNELISAAAAAPNENKPPNACCCRRKREWNVEYLHLNQEPMPFRVRPSKYLNMYAYCLAFSANFFSAECASRVWHKNKIYLSQLTSEKKKYQNWYGSCRAIIVFMIHAVYWFSKKKRKKKFPFRSDLMICCYAKWIEMLSTMRGKQRRCKSALMDIHWNISKLK